MVRESTSGQMRWWAEVTVVCIPSFESEVAWMHRANWSMDGGAIVRKRLIVI